MMHEDGTLMSAVYKGKNRDRSIYKYTLVLDETSIICAFFSSFAIRYNAIMNWANKNTGIYVSMILTVFLFNIIVFFSYDMRRPSIVDMDPFDNLLKVCKNRFILSLLTVLYFYTTQKSVLASRIVMGLFLIFSVVYGYLFRMLFRWFYKNKMRKNVSDKIYKLILPVSNINRIIDDIENNGYDSVLVRRGTADDGYVRSVFKMLEKRGIRAFLVLNSLGYDVRAGLAVNVKSYLAIPPYIRSERFYCFGVKYCSARLEEAVFHVIEHLKNLKGKYICFSNVHTSVMAADDREYAKVLNSAELVFPDGAPIAKLGRKKGFLNSERVAGPDFMNHMFSVTRDGSISHYFYGSTEETLAALKEKLQKKYPGINIKGMYSPPFRQSTPEEDEEDIRRINDSGADIVWIGLGAPKQEKWMYAHKNRINAVMMGVGAGFDFHAGTIQRAPSWLQKLGLEWLYRLFTDPKRLFKRYLVTNIKFFIYLMMGK